MTGSIGLVRYYPFVCEFGLFVVVALVCLVLYYQSIDLCRLRRRLAPRRRRWRYEAVHVHPLSLDVVLSI